MSDSKEYRPLSEEQKESYKHQLQRASGKDFYSEFSRRTDLERRIIDEHGFDGIKLLFEASNRANYFQLGEFPPDCPWIHLNDTNLTECIETDFKAISHKIPNLLAAMKERCQFIYAEKGKPDWKLHFFLNMTLHDGREYFVIYSGGNPSLNPIPNESLIKFGWAIPRDLAEFYSIHDGFGEMKDSIYILSSKRILVLGKMMNPICEKENISFPEEYNFNDLLEFFPDGSGNGQYFHRIDNDALNAQTVDWDHETWEISGEQGFYEFIDERMCKIDEE